MDNFSLLLLSALIGHTAKTEIVLEVDGCWEVAFRPEPWEEFTGVSGFNFVKAKLQIIYSNDKLIGAETDLWGQVRIVTHLGVLPSGKMAMVTMAPGQCLRVHLNIPEDKVRHAKNWAEDQMRLIEYRRKVYFGE